MHNRTILVGWVILKWLLFFIVSGFASNIIWGWAMDRIGLVFLPQIDALMRIGVVFLFFQLLLWWKPGKSMMSRVLRHVKLWITLLHKPRLPTVVTRRQTTLFQTGVSIVLLVLCFSQFNYFVDSAKDVRAAASNNLKITGMRAPNGLQIEFAARRDGIDPVNIELSISGETDIRYAAWWDSPGAIGQSPTFLPFDKLPVVAKIDIKPPNFIVYTTGAPLSSTNSLYVFIAGSPVIESCTVNGEHFVKGGKWLVLDKK